MDSKRNSQQVNIKMSGIFPPFALGLISIILASKGAWVYTVYSAFFTIIWLGVIWDKLQLEFRFPSIYLLVLLISILFYYAINIIGIPFLKGLKEAVELIFIGVLMIAGMWWQYTVIRNDYLKSKIPLPDDASRLIKIPARIRLSIIFSLIIILGAVTLSVIYFRENDNFTLLNMAGFLGKIILFCAFLSIQAYLGPLFLAFSLSVTVNNVFQHESLLLEAIVTALIEWIFGGTSELFENLYIISITLFVLSSSIRDTNISTETGG